MAKRNFNLRKVATIVACLAVSTLFTGCWKEDDPNNNFSGKGSSRDNPITVTVGFTSSYSIQSSGEHWFKFVGTGNPVIFETKGNVVDTYMETEKDGDSYYNTISNDNNGEGSNALVCRNTTSGTTYYVKITTKGGTSGTYTFAVTAPFYNIKTNPISVTVGNSSSHVMGGGEHWFKFIGDGQRIFFETEGNVVNTRLSISAEENDYTYYYSDKRINFITVSGTTYFICITGNAGTYTFKLRHGTGDGSTRYLAKEVTKGYNYSHNISYGGEHWFIYQGTGAPVTFKTTGNVVDTYMEFYEGNDSYCYYSNDNGGEGSNALLTKNTTSGQTYFIKVTQKSCTTGTYNFVVE